MAERLATMVLAASLIACSRRDGVAADTPAGNTSAPSPHAPSAWTVSETGWGPIRAGVSVASARAAFGGYLAEPANRECDHVGPPVGTSGLLMMVVRDTIVRVEVENTTIATAAGARVGDTEARIHALYPGRVQTLPHKYVDGHYLVVRRGARADSMYRLVFETDGQRVTRYRGGRFPEVEWVEGCS
jgi:hypothetical protein